MVLFYFVELGWIPVDPDQGEDESTRALEGENKPEQIHQPFPPTRL